ncbi:MAG: glycosyl hydrolase, partial [Promethearchaeota archaeon]
KDALVVSHFSRRAITNHIEAFLGKGKTYFGDHFGKTFRAFFTDSLELISPMNWQDNFLEEFKKRRGYDLSPYLPVTYIPLRDVGYWSYSSEVGLPCFDFEGDLGARIRYDYERTISDLFVNEFIKVLQEWGEKHGLQSRVQGYGVRVDNLEMLGYSGIPETEQLYCGGMLHFLKLAGAAGTLYNRPIVTSESMVWMHRAYMTTPLKWRVAADRLFESGINQMIYHGFPYRHPDYAYPGFQPFSVPNAPFLSFAGDFSRDNIFWKHFPLINGYIARIQFLMQKTKTVARVGIFYGLFDMPNGNYKVEELTNGVLDETDAQVLTGILRDANVSSKNPKGERLYVKEMAELGDILVANGYYYLNFNRDRLLKANIADGKVIMGEAEFEVLIFFKETHLPFEILAKLEEIAAHNIPIIFIENLPTRQSGFKDMKLNDPKIKAACETMSKKFNSLLTCAPQIFDYLTTSNINPQLRFSEPHPEIGFIQKYSRDSNEQVILLRNRRKVFTSLDFTLSQTKLLPFRLDALTGKSYRLPFETLPEGEINIKMFLEAYQSIVIGLASEEKVSQFPQDPNQVHSNQGILIKEISNWDLRLSKRNVDGTTQLIQASFITPEDWRNHKILRKCSGPADYSTDFNLKPDEVDPNDKYILVFERVADIATITVNGKLHDPILFPPWQVDITSAIQAGSNSINVMVETTLRNLLVGYANDGSKLHKQYKKRPLMPSGLIGKVSLRKL